MKALLERTHSVLEAGLSQDNVVPAFTLGEDKQFHAEWLTDHFDDEGVLLPCARNIASCVFTHKARLHATSRLSASVRFFVQDVNVTWDCDTHEFSACSQGFRSHRLQ